MSVQIPLLCFNDVYRVSQRYVPQPHAPTPSSSSSSSKEEQNISVSQFGQLLLSQRDQWPDRPQKGGDGDGQGGKGKEGEKEGLVLFAGDVFNPSVESSVTRGSHMVGLLFGLDGAVRVELSLRYRS